MYPERVALPDLVNELVLESAERVREHGLRCELPAALPCGVPTRGGSARFLLNLVDNAVKYSPEGGEIRIAAAPGVAEVCVCVQDSGEGIPAEQLEQISSPFNRPSRVLCGRPAAPAWDSRSVEGSSPRMAVGSRAESAGAGRGSIFSFTLPMWVDDDE